MTKQKEWTINSVAFDFNSYAAWNQKTVDIFNKRASKQADSTKDALYQYYMLESIS